MSLQVGPDGRIIVSPSTQVSVDGTAAETIQGSGTGHEVTYTPTGQTGVAFSGTGTGNQMSFDVDDTGDGYTAPAASVPAAEPVAGVVNGQRLGASAYAAAMRERQQANNETRNAELNQRRGVTTAPAATSMSTIAGLEAQQQQQQQQQAEPSRQTKPRQRRQASGQTQMDFTETVAPVESQVSEVPAEQVKPTKKRGKGKKTQKEPDKPGRKPKQKVAESRIKEANDAAAAKTAAYVEAMSPSRANRIFSRMDERADVRVLQDALDNWRDPFPLEMAWHDARKARNSVTQAPVIEMPLRTPYLNRVWDAAGDEVAEEARQQAEREREENQAQTEREREAERYGRYIEDLPRMFDEEWDTNLPLGDAETEDERYEALVELQTKRSKDVYKELEESPRDMEGKGFDDKTPGQRELMDDEAKFQRNLGRIRDEIRRRLLNPLLMRVESAHVETVERRRNGKTETYGRVRYSVEVENAIHDVSETYGNCSIRSVMALVQLRAGLGIDIKGLLGGKKPSEFKLSDAQFVELCRDIMDSQEAYGHPMGIIDGRPGGNNVRDDSGKFVVVAGTRCYPIGFVPAYILADLSRNPGSKLAGKTVGQIQTAIGNTWVNETYPDLIRNSDGDLSQARAIENMVRAVASFDGVDPSILKIPEAVFNKSMMQMAYEKETARDPSIMRSNEIRSEREKRANDRLRRRYLKGNGGRDANGNLNSPSRRRFSIGDVAGGISSFEMLAKASDVFLWITSPIEAAQALTEQSVADNILMRAFDKMNPEVREQYKVTDQLAGAATSRDGIEAISVAEALFRIGGFTAIDAFLGETDSDGRRKNRLTKGDLRRFLAENGITGGFVPDEFMKRLGIDPSQKFGFLANLQGAMGYVEDTLLSGGGLMFKEKEAGQFVSLSMMQMARAAARNQRSGSYDEETYTSSEVEQWANMGSEEMFASLLRTEAGREAFMSQGATSLGRKSPWSHVMRQVLAKNRVAELVVRTCFDRFPEYGLNKVLRQIPFSNTMSYLASYGITGVDVNGHHVGGIADVISLISEDVGEEARLVGTYQAGRRDTFLDGLTKNLVYDSVMAGNRLVIGTLYWAVLQALGGLHRPPRDDDDDELLYTWSEWTIGNDEQSLPMKWAWFMDDISGIGLPLGAAFAIASSESGTSDPTKWTPEAKSIAARTFINAIANFNDGTVVMDAIDLFNNFDEEMEAAIGNGEVGAWLNPSRTEKWQTTLELQAWKLLGDLTPTVVKQLLPWSRDNLFRGGDPYKRSASRVYDDEGRTMKEAIDGYKTKTVDSYHDYMIRREAQNNPIAALFMDIKEGAGFFSSPDDRKTGYMFTEQPIKTETDKLAKTMWDRYSLDENDLPRDVEKRKEACRAHAEFICQEIDANFKNPYDALEKEFIMNPTARIACQEYCYWMMYDKIPEMRDAAVDEMREKMGMYYLDDEVYDGIMQTYDDMFDHYKDLSDYWFGSDSPIPWSLPKYAVLDSDYETRYETESGGPGVNPVLGSIANLIPGVDMPLGEATKYSYGNRPNDLPFYWPEYTGLRDQESRPYWLREDENGNLLTDTTGLYDMLTGMGDLTVPPGMTEEEAAKIAADALAARDLLYGREGREGVPTAGKRGLVAIDDTVPDGLKTYYDPEQASKVLGFDAFDKEKKDAEDAKEAAENKSNDGGNRYYYFGGGSYYSGGGSYYSGGGGGGYVSAYSPKIYSSGRQVNGDRASGMRTMQPYKPTTTYLRPSFYTSGSREAYRRQQ